MTRWITVGAAATAVIFSLACGGGGGFPNQAACKAWIEKSNGLPCMASVQMDAETSCPAALDMNPNDMASYYTCMEENAKCNGDIPDLAKQADCRMPF